MASHLFTSRRALFGALAVALLTSACSALGPRAERWTPPPLGASWQVLHSNTGSYGPSALVRFTREEGMWEGEPVIALRESTGNAFLIGPDGHWRAIVGPMGRTIIRWNPPLGFEYPLTVGKSWVKHAEMMIGESRLAVTYDRACKVEAHEKVAVRAGVFEAFKIGCTSTLGEEETYWINPDMGLFIKMQARRSERNPLGAGTHASELVSLPARIE